MELTLERSDLCQVGTISHLNTLALTEDKKSGRLRIVVGDDNGDVQAFEVKRGDAKSIFKTSAGKGGVQAVCTGGGKVKDRVFCAVGQVVVGLGRKGKQFFSLQSSLVEPIRFLSVDEALLFTGGEYAHSRYRDGAEKRIRVLLASPPSPTSSEPISFLTRLVPPSHPITYAHSISRTSPDTVSITSSTAYSSCWETCFTDVLSRNVTEGSLFSIFLLITRCKVRWGTIWVISAENSV